MTPQSKLATCCYCGKRSVLSLSARDGHELACASCGAPLHTMKALKTSRKKGEEPRQPPARKPKKQKRRKPMWQRALGEIWDQIEDIID